MRESDILVYRMVNAYNDSMKNITDDELKTIYKGRFFWVCGILRWSVSRFVYLCRIAEENGYTESTFPAMMGDYLSYVHDNKVRCPMPHLHLKSDDGNDVAR